MGTGFKIKDWNVTMIPTATGCKDSTLIKELADPYDMLAMIVLLLKYNTPKRRPGVCFCLLRQVVLGWRDARHRTVLQGGCRPEARSEPLAPIIGSIDRENKQL